MKKKLALVLSLVMAITVFAPVTSSYAMTNSDLSYTSTDTKVTVKWQNAPEDTDHFLVNKGGSNTNLAADASSWTFTATPNTSYKVTVKAVDIEGTTLETATITTKSKLRGNKFTSISPKTGLKKARVRFTPVKGATKYQVKVFYNGKQVGKTYTTKKRQVVIKGLKKFKKYTVKVRGYNKSKNVSNWVSKTFVNTGALDKYHYYDKNGKLVACDRKMYNIVNDSKYYSKTPYLVICNRDKCRVCVYKSTKKKNGKYRTGWKLYKYWKCTTGSNPHKSPCVNRLSTGIKKLYFNGNGYGGRYTCWYATNIIGGVHFHSEVYALGSKSHIISSGLGTRISHGCIRVKMANAIWMYNNIKKNTRIIVYKTKK